MTWRTLYLDTNHLSDLARGPSAPEAAAVIRLLQSGDLSLAFTLLHFVELSDIRFKSFPELKALISDLPIAWTVSTTELWDAEVAVACAKARGIERAPPKVFCDSSVDWSRGPSPAVGSAADFLQTIRDNQPQREQLLKAAEDAARLSDLKTAAVIVANPDIPLLRLIEEHLNDRRASNFDYAFDVDPASLLATLGRRAFPSASVHQSIIRQRLLDTSQKSTGNDVFDEYHAAYAPYCVATALDRRTLARARGAKINDTFRMTSRLAEVPKLMEQVASGSSTVTPSAP